MIKRFIIKNKETGEYLASKSYKGYNWSKDPNKSKVWNRESHVKCSLNYRYGKYKWQDKLEVIPIYFMKLVEI